MNAVPQMLTSRIPLKMRKCGGRRTMISSNVLAVPPQLDVTLVKALARARRWRQMLEEGSYSTIKELAAADKFNAPYLCRVLRLTLLAPDLIEVILDEQQPVGMALPGLLEGVAVEWEQQSGRGQ